MKHLKKGVKLDSVEECLGYVSSLFMTSKKRGVDITMPSTELMEVAKRIRELHDEEVKTLKDEVEQLRVQLAGCSVAALGYAGYKGKNDCKKGDYGWSPAFEDVKTLWKKYNSLYEESKRRDKDEEK